MTPRIESIPEKKLVGLRMPMSFADYRIAELWGAFIPRSQNVQNRVSNVLMSLAIYPKDFSFLRHEFKADAQFERWVGIEVSSSILVPSGMETLIIPAGLYAIFHYKGLNTDTRIFQYIHEEWLPSSEYTRDHRPHFEILGEKYKNADPDSEEDIYIPIKVKA